MLRRFPQNHGQPFAAVAGHRRRVFVPPRNQLVQSPPQPRLNAAQIPSVPGGYLYVTVSYGQHNRVAGAGRGDGGGVGKVPQGGSAGFAAFLNEQARQLPFLHRGTARNLALRWQPFQPRQVLAGDFIVRRAPQQPFQSAPRPGIIAQFHQRFGQPVCGLAIVGTQLQNGPVRGGGPFPVAFQSRLHGCFAKVRLFPVRRPHPGKRLARRLAQRVFLHRHCCHYPPPPASRAQSVSWICPSQNYTRPARQCNKSPNQFGRIIKISL